MKAFSLIKEVLGVAGGGGGGRATLDIQYKITCLRMIIHLSTSLICYIKQSELYFVKEDLKFILYRFIQDCNRKGVPFI